MSGVISFRLSKPERTEVRRRYQEAGFPNLSAYIRTRLGFDPDGGMDPVVEYDELTSENLLKTVAALNGRVDQLHVGIRQLLRHAGIRTEMLDQPRQYPQRPPAEVPDESGWGDVLGPREERTTAMPSGFER